MHKKMSTLQRAKQFMPFSALKGFEERIAAMNRQQVHRRILSEDQLEELNYTFSQIEVGMTIAVTVFIDGEYCDLIGTVQRLLLDERRVIIDGQSILIDAVVSMRIL